RSFGIGFGNRVRLPEAADPPTVADLPARCGAIAAAVLSASPASGSPTGSGVRSNFLFRLYSSSFPMRAFYPTQSLLIFLGGTGIRAGAFSGRCIPKEYPLQTPRQFS